MEAIDDAAFIFGAATGMAADLQLLLSSTVQVRLLSQAGQLPHQSHHFAAKEIESICKNGSMNFITSNIGGKYQENDSEQVLVSDDEICN